MGGFLGFCYRQLTIKPKGLPTTISLEGKTALITGANSGLGLEAARELVAHKLSRLIIAVRDVSKGEAAKKSILESTKSTCEIEVWPLDYEFYDSIIEFQKRIERLDRLDYALLNAGVKMMHYSTSPLGHETNVQINHLGTSAVSLVVLPTLEKTAEKLSSPVRLTIVSSEGHFWIPFKERTADNILKRMNVQETFGTQMQRYYTTKLLNVLWTRELSSKVPAGTIIINTVNPGFCYSGLHRHESSGIIKIFLWMFGWSSAEGGYCLTNALIQQDNSHGKYLSEQRQTPPSPFVLSSEGQDVQQKTNSYISESPDSYIQMPESLCQHREYSHDNSPYLYHGHYFSFGSEQRRFTAGLLHGEQTSTYGRNGTVLTGSFQNAHWRNSFSRHSSRDRSPLCASRSSQTDNHYGRSWVTLERPQYLPSLQRFENEEKSLMNLCGNLFCSDYPGDIMRVNAREIPNKTSIVYDMGSVRIDLSTYQYSYGALVSHETRISREIRQRKFLRHDLIGYLQPGCAKRRPSWRNVLRLKDVPCLNDHKLLPNPVLPGSAYVCMAIEALSQHVSGQHKILGKHSFKLRNVLIRSALQIPQNDTEASHGTILLERCIDPNTDPELLSEIVRRERFFYLNDFERELAVKDGIVYISRLIFDEELNVEYRERYNSQKETALEPMGSHAALRAHFSKPGLISSLVFQSDKSMLEPLQPDYMEIRTAAIGLNWKDLASSTGKIDMDTLSSECSSIITKRGSVVQGLRPGDHIYGLAWANFGTTIRLPAGFAQKMRPEDCFEEMVGVPIIFCTAHYGLNHLARLEGGERVLIQGATGGVGLAAIQVARSIGADIYVTAGNQAKVDFLHEQIGFEKERILSSRNEDGLLRIPSITNGRGFDAILSTSTGSMMHESWRYLAPRGRFIDVGRIDVQNGATLSMEVFRRNALYASYDLSIMARQDAAFSARLMREVNEMIITGVLHPISPLKTFDISELESALMYFSQGKHIGKVAVTYTVEEAPLKIIPHKRSARFDPDSVYILVGGAEGFGLGILQMMATRGARHFEIWSCSGVLTPEAVNILKELAQSGINVSVVKCDITDASSVDASMSNISLPIKGIMHAAVTFCDHAFEVLTYADWTLGLSAKVTGTQNLHEATLKYNLSFDVFIVTSSYEAVVALPTQATYCAANSFQDAFARYRRSMGLPACAIAVGLITEIGYVGQVGITRNMIDRNNLYGTGELGILRLLEAAFLDAPLPKHDDNAISCPWRGFDPLAEAQITTFLEPTKLAAMLDKNGTNRGVPRWMGDKEFSHIVRATEDQRSGTSASTLEEAVVSKVFEDVRVALRSGNADDGRKLVIASTKDKMSGLLGIPVGTIQENKSVAEYGVDSLIAVELRNWFLTTFKTVIPLLRLLDESMSIAEQAEWILQGIYSGDSK